MGRLEGWQSPSTSPNLPTCDVKDWDLEGLKMDVLPAFIQNKPVGARIPLFPLLQRVLQQNLPLRNLLNRQVSHRSR